MFSYFYISVWNKIQWKLHFLFLFCMEELNWLFENTSVSNRVIESSTFPNSKSHFYFKKLKPKQSSIILIFYWFISCTHSDISMKCVLSFFNIRNITQFKYIYIFIKVFYILDHFAKKKTKNYPHPSNPTPPLKTPSKRIHRKAKHYFEGKK